MFTRRTRKAILSKAMDSDEILRNLYAQGLTYPEIGQYANLSAKDVQRRIRKLKMHVKATEPDRTPEELQELRGRIRDLRNQGLTMREIGRQIGITTPQIYRHVQAMGLD